MNHVTESNPIFIVYCIVPKSSPAWNCAFDCTHSSDWVEGCRLKVEGLPAQPLSRSDAPSRFVSIRVHSRLLIIGPIRNRHLRLFARTDLLYPPPMDNPDQLRELFRMQRALNERIGVRTEGMNEEDKVKWLLNYCRAVSQEIAELTDSVPWKWWAKYQKFDEQNARVEVVDLFHFLISLAQVLGMSADDVFSAYVKKNEVNFQRQEGGYATKDEHDSKHI
jgi:dimeric dUTPase (all-alpha-NTP-PPase superfamily)